MNSLRILAVCMAALTFALCIATCLKRATPKPVDHACRVSDTMCVESTDGKPGKNFVESCDEKDQMIVLRRCSRLSVQGICEQAIYGDGTAIRVFFYKGYPGAAETTCQAQSGRFKGTVPPGEDAAF